MHSYTKLGIYVPSIFKSYFDSQEQYYGQTCISITTESAIIIISHTHLLVVNHNSDCVFLVQFIHTPAISDLSDWGGGNIFLNTSQIFPCRNERAMARRLQQNTAE